MPSHKVSAMAADWCACGIAAAAAARERLWQRRRRRRIGAAAIAAATTSADVERFGQPPIAQATVVSSAPPPAYAPAPGGAAGYDPTGIVTGIVAPDQVYVNPQLSISELPRSCSELDLEKDIVEDLLSVAGADIVVVADDSGSMSCVANPGNYQNPMTRWDELRETLVKLAHMLLVVDHADGFNVQFLNDPTWHEVHSGSGRVALRRAVAAWHDAALLLAPPRRLVAPQGPRRGDGPDPHRHDGRLAERRRLGPDALAAGKKANASRHVAMCTEDDDVVGAYNRHLDRIPGVDITDDYASEKKEVEAHGRALLRVAREGDAGGARRTTR
ncbi:hypothetical protein JL720_17319 [Aureococcus anophagefferens]|nr:hypothetical protein JL720_17319 [Aureococcus anophagefferens]